MTRASIAVAAAAAASCPRASAMLLYIEFLAGPIKGIFIN